MKTTIVILLITIFSISCNKDEEKPNPNASTQVFENNVPVEIPDFINQTIGNINAPLNVTASGTLVDLSKMTLELKLKHAYADDFAAILIPPGVGARTMKLNPNATGYEDCFIYRVGNSSDYLADNVLRFNTTFTNMLATQNGFLPAGNYKESKDGFYQQILNPLFQNLQGKSVNGEWRLLLYDFNEGDKGQLISWKLIFDSGAIK
jgi:subtilisin-like proprotein convertase family protein